MTFGTIIKSEDMYATSAFMYQPDVLLHPYLRSLDHEENQIQEREEEMIQRLMPKHRKGEAITWGFTSGGFTGFFGFVISSFLTDSLSEKAQKVATVVCGPVLGTAVGVTVGLNHYLNPENGRTGATIELDIYRHRIVRLNNKILRINNYKQKEQLVHEPSVQLDTVRFFFQEKVELYQARVRNHYEVNHLGLR
jgi:hypothetical protein